MFARQKEIKISRNDVLDLVVYALIGVLAGGRLGYVLFYNLSHYLAEPLKILAVWEGGMSFHGGLIGAFIAVYYFCRKRELEFWKIADILIVPVPIALFLGRIGNFINGELYGRITEVPWAFKFKNAEGYRHPSQLYEAFKNIMLFLGLWWLKDRKLADGFVFWSFVLGYGVLRFLAEFFREPDAHIGLLVGLSMGQWLCLLMAAAGAIMLCRIKKQGFYNAES